MAMRAGVVMTQLVEAVAPAHADDGGSGGGARVVYLLGAGATQGNASYVGSSVSLVMPGLIGPLTKRMHELVHKSYEGHPGIRRLVNEVVDDKTDLEHLITFLEDATSRVYQSFAAELKEVFSSVLRARLDAVKQAHGANHSELYAALIDMHNVSGLAEELQGFLTLNYDAFLEHAIEEHHGHNVDYGVAVVGAAISGEAIRVLKLHGSFGWSDDWPIETSADLISGLWIPPGIRKAKAQYPFNSIWGLARELLDCDVLRIVGCNLGPNDWDLVSLLFTSMHTHANAGPYKVEVVSGPETAERIDDLFPYLEVNSLLEIPEIGPQLVGEMLASEPRDYQGLPVDLRKQTRENAQEKISNPFERWLRVKGELMLRDLGSISTASGIFERFVAS